MVWAEQGGPMVCSSISTRITTQTKSVQDSPCRQALPQGRENAWARASKSQQGGVGGLWSSTGTYSDRYTVEIQVQADALLLRSVLGKTR